MADFQGQRHPLVPVQLLALPEPSAQNLRTLLDDEVARKQTLMDGAFGLPPQRLGESRNKVSRFGDRHRLRSPGRAMLGEPGQEQQPGDADLRPDMDLDSVDPGRAHLPGRTDLPEPGAVRGRYRSNDVRPGQRPALLVRQGQIEARAELGELDTVHELSGAAAMALRRLARP